MDILGLSGEDIDELGMYTYQSYLNYCIITFFSNKMIKQKNGVSDKDKDEESMEFPQPDGWNLEPSKEGGVL